MKTMDRRRLLQTVAAGASAGLTGCLDGRANAPEGVVLPPPERHEMLREAELPHPVYGEPMPQVSVHDPLEDETVSTSDYEGERHLLTTLFFTRCNQTCPTLVSNLVQVQAKAAEEGWSDEVMLLAVTFDPEHDTEEVLREYADRMGVDLDAGNFRFLRPEDEERAKEVVEEGFGGIFQRSRIEEHEADNVSEEDGETHDHDDGDSTVDDDSSKSTVDGASADGLDGQQFLHSDLTLLANEGGMVERAYTPNPPTAPTVVDHVRTLVEEYDG